MQNNVRWVQGTSFKTSWKFCRIMGAARRLFGASSLQSIAASLHNVIQGQLQVGGWVGEGGGGHQLNAHSKILNARQMLHDPFFPSHHFCGGHADEESILNIIFAVRELCILQKQPTSHFIWKGVYSTSHLSLSVVRGHPDDWMQREQNALRPVFGIWI